MFQYGIVYKLHVMPSNTSLAVSFLLFIVKKGGKPLFFENACELRPRSFCISSL